MFFIGNKQIKPSFSNGGSSSDVETVSAKNLTGNVINKGDKVWVRYYNYALTNGYNVNDYAQKTAGIDIMKLNYSGEEIEIHEHYYSAYKYLINWNTKPISFTDNGSGTLSGSDEQTRQEIIKANKISYTSVYHNNYSYVPEYSESGTILRSYYVHATYDNYQMTLTRSLDDATIVFPQGSSSSGYEYFWGMINENTALVGWKYSDYNYYRHIVEVDWTNGTFEKVADYGTTSSSTDGRPTFCLGDNWLIDNYTSGSSQGTFFGKYNPESKTVKIYQRLPEYNTYRSISGVQDCWCYNHDLKIYGACKLSSTYNSNEKIYYFQKYNEENDNWEYIDMSFPNMNYPPNEGFRQIDIGSNGNLAIRTINYNSSNGLQTTSKSTVYLFKLEEINDYAILSFNDTIGDENSFYGIASETIGPNNFGEVSILKEETE